MNEPKPGDTVVVRDWLGSEFLLRVKEVIRQQTTRDGSPRGGFGDSVTGWVIEGKEHGREILGAQRTLPLSHVVPGAKRPRKRRVKRGGETE